MRTRFINIWDDLRTSYWFVPGLLAVLAIGLSVLTIHLDEHLKPSWARSVGWIWAGGPEGARKVLSTIASSMIGVAGVTFSITIVALQLASTQFGPRVLRNFLTDTGNQVVLGTFVATFLSCLLVLRTVRGLDQDEFVPNGARPPDGRSGLSEGDLRRWVLRLQQLTPSASTTFRCSSSWPTSRARALPTHRPHSTGPTAGRQGRRSSRSHRNEGGK